MFENVKSIVTNKYAIVGATVAGAMAATPAFAVGVADTAVTAAFTGLADNVVATLGAVAAFAVPVVGVFLAWKYGRKIFGQVAK